MISRLKGARPGPTLVVACLALFLATGGAAVAANAINGKNIKNGTIAGAKIKKDALTGVRVKESSLGPVPSAIRADHATTADQATSANSARTADRATVSDRSTTTANADDSDRLGNIPAPEYLHAAHLVTATSGLSSDTKTVVATCPAGEHALGGGGSNDAPTGTVTFDGQQLGNRSMTVTEFEVNGGTGAEWHAFAQVSCAA